MHKYPGIFLLTASLLLTACGAPSKPVDFKPGEHQCSYCMMGIADMRFRGEAITHKGKVFHFDSIECLEAWSHEHHTELNSAWVGDFMQKGKWINRNKALIMHSNKLSSPMGAGLSAYETQAGLEQAQKLYSGTQLNNETLKAHIQKWVKGPAGTKSTTEEPTNPHMMHTQH